MRYIPVIILLLITVLARGFVRGTDEAPAVPALTPFEIEQMPAPGIADTSCNRITGNVQALEGLFGEFARLERGEKQLPVAILQLGDSHVQAGFFPNRVRSRLQMLFGDAGRGLIAPLRLSGTNEPPDYAIASSGKWTASRCTQVSPDEMPGVTGMALSGNGRTAEFTITAKDSPFDRLRAFHHREAPLLKAPDSLTDNILCPLGDTEESTMIPLRETVTSVTLRSATTDTAYARQVYYGFSLENGNRGILFHSMGINGNTFTAMNRNPQIVRQAVPLQPELIILSLGTNDSYGRNFDEAAVGAQVEKLIGLLKEYFPLCPLLLTTPMECWSRVRVKGRYVRKPNPNAERVRDQIVQAAGRHGLPVCGGRGRRSDGAVVPGRTGRGRPDTPFARRLPPAGRPALRRAGESLQRLQGTARNDRYCRGRPSTEKDRNAYGGNGCRRKEIGETTYPASGTENPASRTGSRKLPQR